MSKVLVTGIAGFIGSHVADILIENGHEVVGIDNLITGDAKNVNPKAKWIVEDIRCRLPDEKFDYIYHLASLARIQPSIDDPVEAHDVNVNGTLKVLELARKCKAKIIFSSTSCNYVKGMRATKEKESLHPKNPYGLQKMIAEQYIQLYGRLYDLDYTIFRYFNVFGERQILSGSYAAVVGIYLDLYKQGKPLTITGSGEQRRDFTYVKDVAQANLDAMYWPQTIVNIGTATNYSLNEMAEWFPNAKKKFLPKREGEVFETLADISRATSLGWKPTVDIKDWLKAQL